MTIRDPREGREYGKITAFHKLSIFPYRFTTVMEKLFSYYIETSIKRESFNCYCKSLVKGASVLVLKNKRLWQKWHTFRSRTLSSSTNSLQQAMPRKALQGAEALALGRLPSYWIELVGVKANFLSVCPCWMTAILLFDWKVYDLTFWMRFSYLPVPAVPEGHYGGTEGQRELWSWETRTGLDEGSPSLRSFLRWDRKNSYLCKST